MALAIYIRTPAIRFFTGIFFIVSAALAEDWSAYQHAPRTSISPQGWSIVSSPNTAISRPNGLSGVTCVSATDCWAVGYSTNSGGRSQTLAEHWNGLSWNVVNSANVSPNESDEFTTLTCVSSSDCWAVGTRMGTLTLIEHWDGISWSIVNSPQTTEYLTGVTCTSSNNCWAVGITGTGTNPATLTEHWDGTAWTIVSSPNPSTQSYLVGVNCESATDCWAVGTFQGAQYPYKTLVEHWDGLAWSIVPSINPGTNDNGLNSVHCISSSDCWAAGGYTDATTKHTLIEHWDGNYWTMTVSPDGPSSSGNHLFSINCNMVSDCWSVGSYSDLSNGAVRTLIEHWDGSSWSVVTSPNRPVTFENHLYDVACSDAMNCWAVGYYANSNALTLIEEYSLSVPPILSVGSRMTHGDAGPFDINLPLNGSPGVECRSSNSMGAGNYSIVFSFVNNITNCGSAASLRGTVVPGPNANQCTESLTGVADQQTINVELDNVIDAQNNTGNVSVPMGVLVGDASGDGFVNVGDTAIVRNNAGGTVSLSNYRCDLNADGAINVGDTAIVRSQSGTGLLAPSAPPGAPVNVLGATTPASNDLKGKLN